ncbi:MAG: AI-2E family transporter, partial [Gemmataceae bacterium]|nr:AI-2E family transporter [Gemmataceae bacterium]
IGLVLVLGVVYQAAGLRQAWTWALLAGILSYVPYIGTIIAGVPPALDAFVFVGPTAALSIILFYILVVTFEGYVVVPVVMGRSMDLNATTVLLACLFWNLVWGTAGLFLAMPLMAAIRAVCMSVPGWQPWANLMGTSEGPAVFDRPSPSPSHLEQAPLIKEFTAEPGPDGPPLGSHGG